MYFMFQILWSYPGIKVNFKRSYPGLKTRNHGIDMVYFASSKTGLYFNSASDMLNVNIKTWLNVIMI